MSNMFQTFSKAWGIKPKVLPIVTSKVEHLEDKEQEVEVFEAKREIVKVERVEKHKLDPPKAVEHVEKVEPKIETKFERKEPEVQREVQRIEVKESKEETISLAYHKHIVFLLFLLNIISLLVLFLLAVLK